MRIALAAAALVLVGVLGYVLLGPRGKEAVLADTAPFEAAISRYLEAKSMGMKVAQFKALSVHDAAAEAVCRMQEASGLHKVTVTWHFNFGRRPDGVWEVLAHETH